MPEARDRGAPDELRYKVGEVCRLADVQPYVLRYWESEFPALAPDRGLPGPRAYSSRELRIVQRIKHLLYDEGFTIAGAKKRLDAEIQSGSFFAAEALEPPPLPVPVPPPLPASVVADAAKPRKSRAKPAPPQPSLEEGVLFEGALPQAPAHDLGERTEPAIQTIPELAVPPPARPEPDPRLSQAIAELREIVSLLSREP